MVFDYYGETLTQYQVKDLSSDKEGMFTGTTFPDVIHAAKTLGYNWRLVRFDPDSMGLSKGMQVLKHELDRGRPIVIGVTESEAPNATFTYQDPRSSYIDLPIDHHININHAVVVTGYDEGAQEMTLMDPARPGTGVRVMSYDRFEYLWHEETTRMRFAVLTGPD
jgi:ABC-type bacteriocin/lantibiotic exporter with double-glycine peptidase domain